MTIYDNAQKRSRQFIETWDMFAVPVALRLSVLDFQCWLKHIQQTQSVGQKQVKQLVSKYEFGSSNPGSRDHEFV